MSLYAIFCRDMGELPPQASLLVAYSGGLDSTVLLALAAQFARGRGISIKALHIAHGLQDAAESWPAHCKEVATSLGVVCETQAVQVSLGPRVSVEAAARAARYQALSAAMQPADILLTGHHLDDQTETLLLALKRGAGVAGLAAMPERKAFGPYPSNQQWRPLLSCSRNSLEQYAHEHNLSWVEDPSNNDDAFDRNFLRNQILPRLLAQWPAFNDTVARSAELCGEQLQLALELAALDLPKLKNNQGGLNVAGLAALTEPRRHNVLRNWLQLQQLHPSRAQLQAIWQEVALARADATPEVRLGQSRICRYQGALYVPANTGQPRALSNIVAEQWLDAGIGQLRLSRVEQGADLVAELNLSQLQLRFNIQGLRAEPQGRAGSRPLKKLWQEYAVAPWLRAQMPLILLSNKELSDKDPGKEELVAIPGLFISQAYAAQPNQAGWCLEWKSGGLGTWD